MKSSATNPRFAVFAVCFAAASLASAAPQQVTLSAQQVLPTVKAGEAEVPIAPVTSPTDARLIPPHLAKAEKLVAELPNATLNVYGEGEANRPFIDWSAAHPAARTVCSTFAALLLEHTYGYTPNQISRWLHSATPNADRVYDAVL